MLPSFVIGLREGVEAALIVGIIASFLRQEGRRDALRPMWVGVGAAIVICAAVGVLLELLDEELPQRRQEGLETVVGIAAIGIVSFMVVWMRRHARGLSGQLRDSARAALAHGSTRALVAMAFFAVIREGPGDRGVPARGLPERGRARDRGRRRAARSRDRGRDRRADLPRRRPAQPRALLPVSPAFVLVLVAAGLVASTLHSAHEAGWLHAGQGQALDLTWLVVPGSWTSALLTGMLGWQPQPTHAELIGYLVYLIPAALYVLWPHGVGVKARAPMTSGIALLVLLLVLVVAGCGGDGDDTPGARTVELKLTDAGCAPARLKLDAGRTTFKVTNAGTGKVSELEILKGARIVGEKENLVAGLSGSFTLTLQPGEYTLSCPGGTTAATGVLSVAAGP